jgi:hypothetical protein
MNDMSSWTSVQQAYEQKHQDTVRTTHINEADSTNQEQEAASPRIPYFILPGTHEAKRWNQELNYVHLHGTVRFLILDTIGDFRCNIFTFIYRRQVRQQEQVLPTSLPFITT